MLDQTVKTAHSRPHLDRKLTSAARANCIFKKKVFLPILALAPHIFTDSGKKKKRLSSVFGLIDDDNPVLIVDFGDRLS